MTHEKYAVTIAQKMGLPKVRRQWIGLQLSV